MSSIVDAAIRADLVLATDSPYTIAFVFEDENGTAVDFTGSTFDLVVKARDASNNPTGSALLTLSTGGGIAGTLSLGQFQPTFPKQSAGGLAAGAYVYEARRLVAAVPLEVVLVGTIDVVPGLS